MLKSNIVENQHHIHQINNNDKHIGMQKNMLNEIVSWELKVSNQLYFFSCLSTNFGHILLDTNIYNLGENNNWLASNLTRWGTDLVVKFHYILFSYLDALSSSSSTKF